jgi:hypothetical protein
MPRKIATGGMKKYEDMTDRMKRRSVSKMRQETRKRFCQHLESEIVRKGESNAALERHLLGVVRGEMIDYQDRVKRGEIRLN